MIIVVIDECLKIANLDLFLSTLTLHQWIKLELRERLGSVAPSSKGTQLTIKEAGMCFQKLLYDLVGFEFIVGNAKYFESLLPCDEAALYSKALLRHLLAALVAELFHWGLVTLLVQVPEYLLATFLGGKGSNHMRLFLLLILWDEVGCHLHVRRRGASRCLWQVVNGCTILRHLLVSCRNWTLSREVINRLLWRGIYSGGSRFQIWRLLAIDTVEGLNQGASLAWHQLLHLLLFFAGYVSTNTCSANLSM